MEWEDDFEIIISSSDTTGTSEATLATPFDIAGSSQVVESIWKFVGLVTKSSINRKNVSQRKNLAIAHSTIDEGGDGESKSSSIKLYGYIMRVTT